MGVTYTPTQYNPWTGGKPDYVWDGNESALGGGHTHPAENITAGTFGAGDYVFPSDVNITDNLDMTSNNITTVDCIQFITGGKICSG